ncbi:MAG: hypothetical protein FJY75_03010 [Candidatus Eisenbacteria bacterium]|uniref:Uncharacterized protein n=1 Tax=Eiseniibacteriota bacterium TaxID=2212470 RepID=A0A938BQE9_UNCEI|nr:hypothetical protein [Candidatus Eisenbacteria bacterium]
MSRRWLAGILLCGSIGCLFGFVIGCGDDEPSRPDNEQPSLLFTREDSSTIQFPASARTWVWCGPWEEGEVPTPTLHILFLSLVDVGAPGWELRAVYDDSSPGDTLRFPNYYTWDQPDSAHIFLRDPPNELATDQEDAGGWIVFRQVPCPGGQEVEFDIDAVLGSELGGMPTVAVRGRFRHAVTQPPPWIGR